MYITAESRRRNNTANRRGNTFGSLLGRSIALGSGVVCVIVAIKTAGILQMEWAARRYGNHSMWRMRLSAETLDDYRLDKEIEVARYFMVATACVDFLM
jgi:hypothetical protein